jgi:hypothetical protein
MQMAIHQRHAKENDEEEHRGLLRADDKNNAPIIIGSGVNDIRFSKQKIILIFCVFILGALFGSHTSSSGKHGVRTAMFSEATTESATSQDVHVSSMCRCGSQIPIPILSEELKTIYETVPKTNPTNFISQRGDHNSESRVIQPPSKATGSYHKRYIHYPLQNCECSKGNGRNPLPKTGDLFLSKISRSYFEQTCSLNHPETESVTNWDQMPDFGVEDKPIFAGILSYKSPLSLNNSLHNWLDHDLFHRIAAQDVFVQVNHRSERDDEIIDAFQQNKLNNRHPLTITGSSEENLHPGMAISKFCRMAEQHPSSHPNGENLLLFLEKDWIIPDTARKADHDGLQQIFRSAIALSQRGVPYISLRYVNFDSDASKSWSCPAQGIPWFCKTAHQHRWTNLPVLLDCSWFLRYLEPFALMSIYDPIMWCGRHDGHGKGYCDWEKAMQDGRIAWTNSQWVIAHLGNGGGQLFTHKEIEK